MALGPGLYDDVCAPTAPAHPAEKVIVVILNGIAVKPHCIPLIQNDTKYAK